VIGPVAAPARWWMPYGSTDPLAGFKQEEDRRTGVPRAPRSDPAGMEIGDEVVGDIPVQ